MATAGAAIVPSCPSTLTSRQPLQAAGLPEFLSGLSVEVAGHGNLLFEFRHRDGFIRDDQELVDVAAVILDMLRGIRFDLIDRRRRRSDLGCRPGRCRCWIDRRLRRGPSGNRRFHLDRDRGQARWRDGDRRLGGPGWLHPGRWLRRTRPTRLGLMLLFDRILHVLDQVLNRFPDHSTDHVIDSTAVDKVRPVALRYAEAMQHMVITVLGDDQAGLVDALSGAVTHNGGNWERSEMIELAGKFAGVVLVSISPSKADGLKADLEQIEAAGLLRIDVAAAEAAGVESGNQYTVDVTGQDHPGIVHEISHALATNGCSIDELSSEVVPAPMGGEMFVASAVVGAPDSMTLRDVQDLLEDVATDLLVDVAVKTD